MNIEILEANKCFIETVKKGSIKQSAELLNLNPNTIRKKIDLLEKYLGITLLNSTLKGQEPTDEGWKYYDSIYNYMTNLELEMHSFKATKASSEHKMKYRICVPVMASIILSKYVIKGAVEKFSNYLFELKSFSYTYAENYGAFYKNMLKDSDFLILDSAYFGLIHPDEWNMSYRYTVKSFNLYASQSYLDKVGPIKSVTDLKGLPLVTRITEGYENGVVKLYNSHQKRGSTVTMNVVSTVGIEPMKIDQLEQGVGIGILDPYLAKETNLVRVLPDFQAANLYDAVVLTKSNHRDVTAYLVEKFREAVK